jgi:hypothetical protein
MYKKWQVFEGISGLWFVVEIEQFSDSDEVNVVNVAFEEFNTAAEAQELADKLNGESE